MTSNLKVRLQEHNEGQVKSTYYRRPFALIYYEAYCSFEDAKTRERKLKHFKNSYKELKKRMLHSMSMR